MCKVVSIFSVLLIAFTSSVLTQQGANHQNVVCFHLLSLSFFTQTNEVDDDSARLLLLMKESKGSGKRSFYEEVKTYEAPRYITKFAKPIKGGYTHEFPLES